MNEWLGLIAGTLTTLSFVPQVVRTWRTRSTRDLSLGMLIAFVIGVTLWLIYGLRIGERPIVVANAITLALALALLGMKIVFRDTD